ncbi:MAG: hypothetical protein ACLGJC_05140 [Alphaproteobacteria bacterium]
MAGLLTDDELHAAANLASAGLFGASVRRMQARGLIASVKVPRPNGGYRRAWPPECIRPCALVAVLCRDLGMSADAASDACKAAEWQGNNWSVQIGAVSLTGSLDDATPSSRESAA